MRSRFQGYSALVADAQGVILQQVLLLFGQGKQRFALSGGQEFTAGHETNLTMNYTFEKPLSLTLSRLSDPPLSLDEDNFVRLRQSQDSRRTGGLPPAT